MEISIHKVRDKVEEIKLKAADKNLDWVVNTLEQWEVELDEQIIEYGKTMEKNYSQLNKLEETINKM